MTLMVAQQCDLNMLNMVTFISNVMALYCLLFWRLPISQWNIPVFALAYMAMHYLYSCNNCCNYLTISYLFTLFQLYWPRYKTIIVCFWLCVCVCVHSVAQSCRTLCNIKGCSPPGSSVHGISQTRTLEWVAVSSSRGFPQSMDQTQVSCIGKWILYHWAIWEAHSLL